MSAPAVDVHSLWDFAKPAASERRFRDALTTATGDDVLILQTQIARTHGLRRDFERAREILAGVATQVEAAGPEARARHLLELGRTLVSATHKPDEITLEARERARAAYLQAAGFARDAALDSLTIDALHMLALVDDDPASQLKWNQQALDLLAASSQPDARRWEVTLRNNAANALHRLGRYDDALALFRSVIPLAQSQGSQEKLRIAHWMVAWTLRSLNRIDEALEIQLALERECDAAGAPDPYVFEELEHLYQAKHDIVNAEHYAARLWATKPAHGA